MNDTASKSALMHSLPFLLILSLLFFFSSKNCEIILIELWLKNCMALDHPFKYLYIQKYIFVYIHINDAMTYMYHKHMIHYIYILFQK